MGEWWEGHLAHETPTVLITRGSLLEQAEERTRMRNQLTRVIYKMAVK